MIKHIQLQNDWVSCKISKMEKNIPIIFYSEKIRYKHRFMVYFQSEKKILDENETSARYTDPGLTEF